MAYILIPDVVYQRNDIPRRSHELFGLLYSLSRKTGICDAGNTYLSRQLNLNPKTVSRDLQVLMQNGLISICADASSGRRVIRVVDQMVNTGDDMVTTECLNGHQDGDDMVNHIVYDKKSDSTDTPAKHRRFQPPSVSEVTDYCREHSLRMDAERFVDYYTANGWMAGRSRMRDWQAAARNWARREQPNTPAEPEMKFVN